MTDGHGWFSYPLSSRFGSDQRAHISLGMDIPGPVSRQPISRRAGRFPWGEEPPLESAVGFLFSPGTSTAHT